MDWSRILPELIFRTSKSSGAGGQHVNKTETRVEVLFHVSSSAGLSTPEKEMVLERLARKINTDGYLSVVSQKERSQTLNKSNATGILKTRLEKAIIPKRKRKATRPTAESRQERLEAKKRRSETKSQRKKPDF